MKHVYRILGGAALALAIVVVIGLNSRPTFADPGVKAVICHAASDKYVGIVVGIQDSGLLSNNGHLDANGSPLSGHEQDLYLGLSPPNVKSDCEKLPPPPK